MTYMRNVKKVTLVAYAQNVMMIIYLNVNILTLTFFPSSATANQNTRQDRLLTI